MSPPRAAPPGPRDPAVADALRALGELVAALERHCFRIRPSGPDEILDFPFTRVVRGPTGLPVVTFGNFSPAVASRLAAALDADAAHVPRRDLT